MIHASDHSRPWYAIACWNLGLVEYIRMMLESWGSRLEGSHLSLVPLLSRSRAGGPCSHVPISTNSIARHNTMHAFSMKSKALRKTPLDHSSPTKSKEEGQKDGVGTHALAIALLLSPKALESVFPFGSSASQSGGKSSRWPDPIRLQMSTRISSFWVGSATKRSYSHARSLRYSSRPLRQVYLLASQTIPWTI